MRARTSRHVAIVAMSDEERPVPSPVGGDTGYDDNPPGRNVRPRRWQWSAVFVALMGLVPAGCGSSADQSGADQSSAGQSSAGPMANATRTVSVAGADRLPNETASDWVTYADYVVEVRPTAAEDQEPYKTEGSTRGGSVLRELTMAVDRVLWTSPTTTVGPPADTFPWLAFGYAFTDGQRVTMAPADSPRLEVGHQYIIALSWEPARCTKGDKPSPAGWSGLGSGGVLPFDEGIIGNGEFSGTEITPTEYASLVPSGTLASSLARKHEKDLVSALRHAKPEPRGDYLPPPAPCP